MCVKKEVRLRGNTKEIDLDSQKTTPSNFMHK